MLTKNFGKIRHPWRTTAIVWKAVSVMLLSHSGDYPCECKKMIFAENFAKNDTIGRDNYWNKCGLTNGYGCLRNSYESLRISYEAYDYLTINLPNVLWIKNTYECPCEFCACLRTPYEWNDYTTPCQCFAVSLLFARLSWIVNICFIRNGFASISNVLFAFVWINANKSLRMSYDHYTCFSTNNNILRLLTKCCENNKNMLSYRILGACF